MRKLSLCGAGQRLMGMLFLTASYMLVELIVGNVTNSMALVADSFHMMSDVLSIIIAYISVRMSPKSWDKNTFGFARAEVVGALINAVFLVALCFSILVDSIHRFIQPEQIKHPLLILIVGGVGLAVNILGLFLFGNAGHGHSHGGEGNHGHAHEESEAHKNQVSHESGNQYEPGHQHGHAHDHENEHSQNPHDSRASSGHQMNIHGVFLHVLSDALGSVVVMISASIIYLTQAKECQLTLDRNEETLPLGCAINDWTWYIDPFLSLILVFIIMASTWPLLRDSTLILLNTVPQHININDLETRLLQHVEGVTSVHELHIWRLVGHRVVASCHLEVAMPTNTATPLDYHMVIAREVKLFFHSCGIHSTTIQLEYPPTNAHKLGEWSYLAQDAEEVTCQLECPKGVSIPGGNIEDLDPNCVEGSCCKKRILSSKNELNKEIYRKETEFDAVTHI